MHQKRNFVVFFLIRYGFVLACLLLVSYLSGSPLGTPIFVVGFALLAGVPSFLEFDSLPSAIATEGGVSAVDPSGRVTKIENVAREQFLWMYRLVYIHEGKVHKIPSEAYPRFKEISAAIES